jgi:hypothetical protein
LPDKDWSEPATFPVIPRYFAQLKNLITKWISRKDIVFPGLLSAKHSNYAVTLCVPSS